MTDEELKGMTRRQANTALSASEKKRWVELHNRCGKFYFIKDGEIEDVPPCGWWY